MKGKYNTYPGPIELGYSEVERFTQDSVDLIPIAYIKYCLAYSKAFDELQKENEGLPPWEQFGWIICNPDDQSDKYIISTSLPRRFIEVTKMPRGAELRKEIRAMEANMLLENRMRFAFKTVAERLLKAYLFKWPFMVHYYDKVSDHDDIVEFYAKKHAIWEETLILWKEGGGLSLRFLHGVFNAIGQLYFKGISLDRFYRLARKIYKAGDQAFLYIHHGSLGKHKDNARFSREAKMIAIDEMCDRNKKMPEVLETVNAYLRVVRGDPNFALDIKTLQRFLNTNSVKNFVGLRRYEGDAGNRNNLLPYLDRDRCVHINAQWQMDTVDIPLACAQFYIGFEENANNKLIADSPDQSAPNAKVGHRLKLCRVIDNHSGLTLGYSVDVSENRWMQIDALKMAIRYTRTVPFELLTDSHRGYETPEFLHIVALLSLKGCRYRQERLQHPEDKALIESNGRDLHAIWRTYSGYSGHGIRSKKKDSHIGREYKKEINKTEHIRDIDGIKALIPEVMATFANHSFKERPSQLQLYRAGKSIPDRQIEDHDVAKMFFDFQIVSVAHAGFSFVKKGQKYIYKIYNIEDSLDLTNTEVRCRFDELDFETTFLFSIEKDIFICRAERFYPVGGVLEEMTEKQKSAFGRHNSQVARMERELNKMLKDHDERMEELTRDLILDPPSAPKESPHPQVLVDDFIQQHQLYERMPKHVDEIVITKMDAVKKQRRNKELLQNGVDPIEVLEER